LHLSYNMFRNVDAVGADRPEQRLRLRAASPGPANHRQADTHGQQRRQRTVRLFLTDTIVDEIRDRYGIVSLFINNFFYFILLNLQSRIDNNLA
jgi:hypothetical protein